MKRDRLLFALAVIFLLVSFPLAAGCLSVPGPDSTKKTTPVTAAVTRSPQATASPEVPATPAPAQVATRAPAVPQPSSPVATPGKTGYAVATCTDQGGFLVAPGQQCTGSWLSATNTFSCCSVQPVSAAGSNRSVQAAPFTLTVNIDDNLGSITP